jgi:glutamyl-tRNA synthetase
METRVRYAPSPTGLQHIGGVRTALFNYFYARANGGRFLLRIEDTDQGRSTEESLQDLYDTLEWLGVTWDEGPVKGGPHGPYIQSERVDLYQKHAGELLAKGEAYYCFCSAERMEKLRQEQTEKKLDPGYDRHCRDLDPAEVKKLLEAGTPHVIRLKIPMEGETKFTDLILGEISRQNKDISPDPVILKTDGFPTYHLANVIDDHAMEVTHVMRAQEWIPSTPLHLHIYRAFGWQHPNFCHLPMVMGPDGSKLSKRHGSTAVRDFRKDGYLPEAVLNYVSLLGWSYDDSREFFSRGDLEKLFDMSKLNKAPAIFDYKKLEWFNGQYIRLKSDGDLRDLLLPYMSEADLIGKEPSDAEKDKLLHAVPLVRERLKKLSEAPAQLAFLFGELSGWNTEEAIPKKMDAAGTLTILKALESILEGFFDRDDAANEEVFRIKSEELGVKLGQMLQPLRVAITGTTVSPPLFESIRLLGRDVTISRVRGLIRQFEKKGV